MSSGAGQNLKSWGKVTRAVQKLRPERKMWEAAQGSLRAGPRLSVGADAQTEDNHEVAECRNL